MSKFWHEDAEADARREAYFDRERLRSNRCQCNFDMPGTCPGPANCPMCETDAEYSNEC